MSTPASSSSSFTCGRLLALAVLPMLFALSGPAGAAPTTMYKCVVNGKATFSSLPCKSGRMTEVLVKSGPNTTVRRAKPGTHEARVAAVENRERVNRQAAEEQQARASAADAARRERCNVLRDEQRAAEDKAEKLTNFFQRKELRAKAREHREGMAAECPG